MGDYYMPTSHTGEKLVAECLLVYRGLTTTKQHVSTDTLSTMSLPTHIRCHKPPVTYPRPLITSCKSSYLNQSVVCSNAAENHWEAVTVKHREEIPRDDHQPVYTASRGSEPASYWPSKYVFTYICPSVG